MTREEKCDFAIENGYKYDPLTGKIYGMRGKEITRKHKGYICINLKVRGKNHNLYGHQLAWYYMKDECVEELDHINGIPNDNRFVNLRSVARNENQWNRKTAKGYYYNQREKKWKAQIWFNSMQIHLGYFNTEFEARNAYLQAKEKYHII
jgi:hypothetical protein